METFGDIIKSARNKAGLSQKQVYQNIKKPNLNLFESEELPFTEELTTVLYENLVLE